MAIVRTNNSGELFGSLVEQFANSFYAGAMGNVVDTLSTLAGAIVGLEGAPSDNGTIEPGLTWEALGGATSASYIQTYTDYRSSGFYGEPYFNGTEKYSFSGSNLNGAVAGNMLATRFTYSSLLNHDLAYPGLLIDGYSRETISAQIDVDLATLTQLTISNFTSSYSSKETTSGFDIAPFSGDGLVSFSTEQQSINFVGTSTYTLGEGYSLTSATLKSISMKYSETGAGAGMYGDGSGQMSYSSQFQLASSAGLGLSFDGENVVLTGVIASITLNNKYSVSGAEEGDDFKYGYQDYYRYTNTASPTDDINVTFIADDLNGEGTADAYYELFKGNDTIVVSNRDASSHIYAGSGNDKITGGEVTDRLYGEDGDDIINGGDGWDFIYGGAGVDVLKGGDGDDLIEGGDGHDTIDGGNDSDSLVGGTGNDRILGGSGNDSIYGDEGNDIIDGGVGNDLIVGGLGRDTLKGGAGQDSLYGGDDNDILDGGAGNDLLMGGAGVDVMTGGSGSDGFFFVSGDSGYASLAALDQIKDFNVAQDRLQFIGEVDETYVLTTTDTAELGKANSYAALLAAAQAANALGEHYVVGYDNGNTYVFADLDGNAGIDFAVQLVGIKGDAVANALVIDSFGL